MKKLPIIAVFGLAALSSGTANAMVAHRHHARSPAVQQHVACTVLGCQPIPTACIPKEEHTSSGIPTGYDNIVCPPGACPLN
jgi:hypothetical protein